MTNITPTATPTPTLSSSALLVELSISCWTGRRKDKDASKRITAAASAADGVAAVHKRLLGDCDQLVAIQKHVAATRNMHTKMTMPWSDLGPRMIPTVRYQDYVEAITQMEQEFWRLVSEFLSTYSSAITAAETALGDLFNPDEYPSESALAAKFGFRCSPTPLPEAGDFRVDLPAEAMATIRQQYEEHAQRGVQNMAIETWRRVHEALERLLPGIDYVDGEGRRPPLHDTTVQYALGLVAMLRDYNLLGDAQMAAMADRLEDAFVSVTTEALKEDAHLRAQVADDVREAIAALPSLDF